MVHVVGNFCVLCSRQSKLGLPSFILPLKALFWSGCNIYRVAFIFFFLFLYCAGRAFIPTLFPSCQYQEVRSASLCLMRCS
uniref:Uncharacterized protein n=1 Tax=Mus musculus TaxID=10090 RepID=Q3TQ79_MOUSE|nr:unnamed protein product [Mus musculus]